MSPVLDPNIPLTSVGLLHRTIDLLEQALCADRAGGAARARPGGPHLVAVTLTERGVELGLLALHDDAATELQGFTAPPEWWAMGLIATGTARRLDAPGQPGWPVEVIHLVARTGEAAAAHRQHGPGAAGSTRSDLDGSAWAGLLDDHLRRAFGLPTTPPPDSTLPFWTARWLDALCSRATAGELALATWSDLAALHPARRLARRARRRGLTGYDGRTGGEIALVDAAEQLAARWSWAALRASAGSADDVLGTIPADVAAWMDDGLYARVHLAAHPDPADLLDVLDDVLEEGLMARLQETCRAWSTQT
jgi:hypothetical protein